MKYVLSVRIVCLLLISFAQSQDTPVQPQNNPYFTELNSPINFAAMTALHVNEATTYIIHKADIDFAKIQNEKNPNFANIFVAFDNLINELDKIASTNYILSQVHPDSAVRSFGMSGYEKIEPLWTNYYSDKKLYKQMLTVKKSKEYNRLANYRKKFVDDLIIEMEQNGVGLSDENLEKMKTIKQEITALESEFTRNLNTYKDTMFVDEAGMEGLPENYKDGQRVAENQYEIIINNANCRPFLANAKSENLRKAMYLKYRNIAADKNVSIIEQLPAKRYELARIMGKASYADMILESRMAGNPDNVWNFLNDLAERAREKAQYDYKELKQIRNAYLGNDSDADIKTWNYSFYRNMLLREKYAVDREKIREYLPMDQCLNGMFNTYQQLLGLKFIEIKNGSVWHEEARMFEVLRDGKLIGRFYLDLFPRANKNTHAYNMPFMSSKLTADGYQIPQSLLLTNFTRPTKDIPSLISHAELSTLYHEFGHVMNNIAWDGELKLQSYPKRDFVEAMSQIFSNWIWNYDIISAFAKHYKSQEVLPKEIFDKMLAAKNVGSGMSTLLRVGLCYYDMTLYHKYNPENPLSSDDIWKEVDKYRGIYPSYVEGTHRQASWIHINGYPVYYYGYLWSDVYAQDMFTQFEKNGLLDQETGKRYSRLIMANGEKRDINEAVREFLGRESNNEAFIKSLGLD